MEIYRREIPRKVLDKIKVKIADYLEKNGLDGKKYRANMDNVGGLYVENVVDQRGSKMVQRGARYGRPQEIAIDKQFVEFDEKKEPKRFKKGMAKLIESQLGHELLHAATRYDNFSGFTSLTNRDNEGLNEGFTQAITEDIFEYTVSPITDSYRDLKKFAKIFTKTFGNKICFNSYFEHTNDLEVEVNKLSGDKNFYKDINSMLTLMFKKTVPREKKDFISDELDSQVYKETVDLAIEKICIKTIIPHMKQLPEQEQVKYIESILDSVNDDQIFSNKISNMIKVLGTASKQVLDKIDSRNEIEFRRVQEKNKVIQDIYNSNKIEDVVNISDDGTITLKNNPNVKISNTAIKTKIYSRIFKEKTSDSTKDDTKNSFRKIMTQTDSSGTIDIKDKSRKFSILAAMQEQSHKNGYLLMFSDSGDNKKFKYDRIKLPKNGEIFDFDDLKKVYEKYTIDYEEDKYSNYNMVIKDRLSGEKLEGGLTHDIAMFANVWAEAAGTKWLEGEKIRGETYAFSDESKKTYYELISDIKESLNDTGVIDTENISARIAGNGYKHSSKIVDKIFGNKEKINIINRFIKRTNEDIGLEVEIPENSQNFRGVDDNEVIKYGATDIIKTVTRFVGKNIGTRTSDIQAQIDLLKNLMRQPEKDELLEIK